MGRTRTIPKGWVVTGHNEGKYNFGSTGDVQHNDKRSAFIKSKTDTAEGFGTLTQGIRAVKYRGKKVTLSAWLKTEDVDGWTGIWLRVDGDASANVGPLEFENMYQRPVKGDTDWNKYEITLPVAEQAHAIVFGFMLCGSGKSYCTEFNLSTGDGQINDINDGDYNYFVPAYINDEAMNLDFELD